LRNKELNKPGTFTAGRWLWIFFLVLLIQCHDKLTAQVYGLAFKSHSSLKEDRTHLDMNPERFFVFNEEFTLSFKFRLQPGENMYFGYVVRLIDSENNNVDLIYNHQSVSRTSFDIFFSKQTDDYTVSTDFRQLCRQWTDLTLTYNYNEQKLIFKTNDTSLVINGFSLGNRIKIIFGASDYNQFKTTDVPPMILCDVRLSHKNRIVHEWLLDEIAGNIAYDKTGKINALVENPDWLNPKHVYWIKIFSGSVPGNAEVAFNETNEVIYIIGNDYLLSVSVPGKTIDTLRYNNLPLILKAGCQAFYDTEKNCIISYNIDMKTIARFDIATGFWTQHVLPNYPLTVYWHHNKLFLPHDSVLYMFGGYGQHQYKNIINRYSFSNDKWDTLPSPEINIPPRYLSALGMMNDTVYLLGGYGSLTGRQTMNPHNFYDLWGYSLRENRFFKKFEFNAPIEDIAFANSMVINPVSHEFYAFACPILVYNSFLQLVKGSLDRPGIIKVGRPIPYLFHDINSFSDLFLCRSSQKLAGVTMLADNQGFTEVNIYTIGFPPNEIYDNDTTGHKILINPWYLIPVFVSLLIVAWGVFILYRKRSGKKKELNDREMAFTEFTDPPAIFNSNDFRIKKNAVLFFGDFQIFNNKGDDCTSMFSPLLKELFLMIWFNSLNDKGISAEKIIELLWFDKNDKSAKNNLAVNITKLKHLLSGIDSLSLSHQTGYWKFTFDEFALYNDYQECLKIINTQKPLNKDLVLNLTAITQKGNFLASSNHEWLDVYKSGISNVIIDALIGFSSGIRFDSDPELAITVADTITAIDMLNEEALKLRCKALIVQGKYTLAKEVYTKFAKEYLALMSVPFSVPFADLIS